jgi:N-acetylmuramoyl-L-alanine amidase
MKQSTIVLSFLLLISSFAFAADGDTKNKPATKQKQGVRRIVIDPGHGGTDFGAPGKYSHEKDIALAVSLKLEAEIKKTMPDVEVYLTRTSDIYDKVTVKAIKANEARGDLFISIHCNSSDGVRHSEVVGYKTARVKKGRKWVTKRIPEYRYWNSPSAAKGTETFIWKVEKNFQKADALREFESAAPDSTMAAEYKKFDDPEQVAMISLKMSQYTDRSLNLATTVQSEFTKVGRISRETKQRPVGIWVLQAVAMPAVLIELGFISNPEEEDYMNSKTGQDELSQCIARAVKQYKNNIEAKMNLNNGGK